MSENYFYHTSTKTSGWAAAPASQRKQVIESKQPLYVTVLDIDRLIADEDPLEETLKARYSGPLYFDWDCAELLDGAASVNRFLDMMEQEHGVDLASIELFFTGGRGFHALVPFATLSSAKTVATQYLPAVYKEMANSLYTEDMDLNIFSMRRGRMWRTPNVQRENGAYKVPVTVAEMRAMTLESYAELCSAPRPFPALAPATLSPSLAAMFSDHQQKVAQRYREKAKRKTDDGLIKRMNNDWPDSVKALMAGENVGEVGLNKIALQLGILSNALGKTLAEHLDACEGLIKSHKGDHSSRRAVREELKRMYGYTANNPAYTYSPAAMAALMDVPQRASDLRGTPGAGTDDPDDFSDLSRGVLLGKNGIFSVREDILSRETNWHFDGETVVEIIEAETGLSRGFILHSMDSGRHTREVNLDHGLFTSTDRFKAFLASQGATAPRMDTAKAGAIGALIMQAARKNGRVYALAKEGFNLVGDRLVWCSPVGCWAAESKDTYRYRSAQGSDAGIFKSDVMHAQPVDEISNITDVLEALLHFNNSDYAVAAMIGWFSACWQKPLHIQVGTNFPILQAYGESGAGKTLACMMMLKLFYHHEQPKAINASQGSAYGRRVMFSGSTSIPILVDEFKPTRMSQEAARDFRMLIHEVYTPSFQSPRGGGDARSTAPGAWADVNMDMKTTPVCFTTETAESETAIQERTISVPFSKAARTGRADAAFKVLSANPEALAAIGKLMAHGTAAANHATVKALIAKSHQSAEEHLSRSGNSRIVYNAGVALAGLGFFGMTLRHQMPESYERLEPRLEVLRQALLDAGNYASLVAAPEIVKLLRFMITLSHQDEADAEWAVRHGIEYAYTGAETDLDISVDAFFMRYRTAVQRRSQHPVFHDPDAFLAALRSSSLAKESFPCDTPLNKGTNAPRVVRLSGAALQEYGLGAFKL
jgi:hypothetical protein